MSQLDRRQILKMFGALAAAGATGSAAACTSSSTTTNMDAPTGRRVSIGLLAPATGPYLSVGADLTDGFKLYLQANSNRLGGNDVDLVVQDEGGTRDSARAATKSLIDSNVIALAGVANPDALTAIRDLVENARIPLVSSNGSPATLTSVFYMWRASYVDGQAGEALGPYVASRYNKAYLLYENTTPASREATTFSQAYTAAGGRVLGESVGSGNYRGLLSTARASGADAVFCSYAGQTAWDLLQAYQSMSNMPVLVGPGSLTESRDLAKLVKGNASLPSVLTSMNYAPNLDNDPNRRFVSSYYKAYGSQPTAYAMAAYDSAAVLDKALRLAGSDLTPFSVNKALSLVGQVESPRGTWTFDVNRTPQQVWYLRQLLRDGQVPANLVAESLATLPAG